MAEPLDLDALTRGLEQETFVRQEGRVFEVAGLTVKSIGPQVSIGELVWVESYTSDGMRCVPCEAVGFRDRFVLLMPFEALGGIRSGARVFPGGHLQTLAGHSLKGRILNGLGRPIDGAGDLQTTTPVPIDRDAPPALSRNQLSEVFCTGVRAIDGLLTMAQGQRMGIFSGSGVGKSVLLGTLARNAASTVNVIALIGERGREVKDFIVKNLGHEGLAKTVLVVVTSDQSPMMRVKGAFTAMAIAEYFRDQGGNVLFMMDSVTRCAMAQREIGLAIGEPPTTKGYPPSVFGLLARLLERGGASDKGSITAFITVLVEGDDMNDPIADTVRSILDGHIVLSRRIATLNQYPAIDVMASISRLMSEIVTRRHQDLAAKLRALIATYQRAEDLINIGAYVKGSNPRIDEAIAKIEGIQEFLRQRPEENAAFEVMLTSLQEALA